jgi:hypothetical protein
MSAPTPTPVPTFDVFYPNEDAISAWLAEFERFYARTNPHIPSVEEQLQNEYSPYYVGVTTKPTTPLFTIRE